MTKTSFRRAAWWLKEWARALRSSETIVGTGKWITPEAKKEYDELLELAKGLNAHARSMPFVSKPRVTRRSA